MEKSIINLEQEEKQNKIKKHFGQCFEISNLENNCMIPIGGKSILSQDADVEVFGDFENFKEFFQETQELAGKYNLSNLKKWLDENNINIEEKIFAKLVAFTKKFNEKYSYHSISSESRDEPYNKKNGQLKLSDLFGMKGMECAEIAALAQKYLQQENITSSYFSGDVLWDSEDEFSGKHSFIVIRDSGNTYIFDPANPVNSTSGIFPSLYSVKADFDGELAKSEKKFFATKNILTKKQAFYGVNNGTNVLADRHIVWSE